MVNTRDREDSLTLEILEAIDQQSDVTQRHLAGRMGVALGLANSYLKRCVRKGFVKIHQAPANRYLYYLTPKGFAEKSRLTAQFLSYSFAFYRRASAACSEALSHCERNGWRRVLLCGASDLAEIASLRASEHAIEVVGVFDSDSKETRFLRYRIFPELGRCPAFDACLVTALEDANAMLACLAGQVPEEQIIVPSILGLRTTNGGSAGASRQK